MKNLKSLLLVLLFSASFSSFGQTHEQISSTLQREIISELKELIKQEYILEETGLVMSQRLDSLLQTTLEDARDSEEFLQFLNQELRSVYFDKHLGVVNPEKFREYQQMFGLAETQEEDKPEQKDHQPEAQASSHGSGHDSHAEQSGTTNELEGSRVINRDGRTNIGLLKMNRFNGTSDGLTRMNQIMNSFVGVDAIIIDLRNCRGGDADMVKALSGYFFKDSTYLVSTIGRKDSEGNRPLSQRWSLQNDLSSNFADTPLYIMTSNISFSAAESFTFGMQLNDRAILVGENTGGGGHMNTFFPLPGGYGVSISVGRTFDKETGQGFQEFGVQPDIAVEAGHAFAKTLETIEAKRTTELAYEVSKENVHQTLQQLSEAWYTGNTEIAQQIIFEDCKSHLSLNDDRVIAEIDLLQLIEQGIGKRTPREVRNREISVYEVRSNETAIARMMLHDQIHYLLLKNEKGSWKVISDLVTQKKRHG